VQDGQLWVPGRIRNGDREETGVFVIHIVEFDAITWSKPREP
jgi:hypothetical protein